MSKLKLKLFYSASTHYQLNHLTLTLKDKEIEKEYLEARAKNFDAHYPKVMTLTIVYLLFRLVQAAAFDFEKHIVQVIYAI
jgi:hypothetical protein